MGGRAEALRQVRAGWSFRAMHTSWREHFRVLSRARDALREDPGRAMPSADVCVVLPSYRRASNLAVSARLALAAPSVRSVVVVNDDPDVSIAHAVDLDDPRVRYVDHPVRVGPVGRYLAARETEARRFISIDDDLFLPPEGIERLAHALRAEPAVPHGFYGQRERGDRRFDDNLARFAGRVDVLNRAYAFTDAHLARYFDLIDALAIDLRDAPTSIALDDDIVLSFCGDGRPRIHDVGPWLDCPSERRPGLARWRRRDAERVRRELYDALLALRPRPPARFVPPRLPRPAPRTLGLSALESLSGIGLVRGAWHRVRRRR